MYNLSLNQLHSLSFAHTNTHCLYQQEFVFLVQKYTPGPAYVVLLGKLRINVLVYNIVRGKQQHAFQ